MTNKCDAGLIGVAEEQDKADSSPTADRESTFFCLVDQEKDHKRGVATECHPYRNYF